MLFLLFVLALCALALANLYSATYKTGLVPFKKQVIWVGVGMVVCVWASLIDYKSVQRYALHIYFLTLALLAAVPLLGSEISGAKSWIALGPVSLQPSEFVKIGVIIALAKFYSGDYENRPYGLTELAKPMIIIGLPVGLIMLQPDLGTAMMICLIAATIILFMGVRVKSLLLLVALIVALALPAWSFFLKDYQKGRITAFLDPSRDPLGSGYNAIQSQIAIGSGRFLGKGFMHGTQTQLRFLPEQHTDFAYSVIGEEFGFVGAFVLLMLYLFLVIWALDTGSKAKDKFSGVVCVGVAAMFFWHLMVNVGMVTGLLPVVGVPLLLISYGGSSLLTAMVAIGLVLGIRMRRFRV